MRLTLKISKGKGYPISIPLLLILMGVCTAASFLISREGIPMALLLIMGAIGLGLSVFMLVYPAFAFYGSIFCAYFIFTVLRLFNTELPLVTSIDGMVWLTFLAILVQKILKRESLWKNCRSPIMLMYLILIVYNFLEFFNPNGGNPQLYFLLERRFITLMLFLYCAIQLFNNVKDMERFFKVWLALALVSAVYACYEEWFGLPAFELHYITSDPLRERLASLDGGNYRKSSFLSGCTDFGLLMSATMVIVLALYLKLQTTVRRRRWLLLSLVLMALAMTYSGTRTATLMLIVEVVLYALMTITEKRTLIFTGVFGFLFAAILLGPSYGNGTIRRLKSTFDLKSEESLQVRDINRHYIQPYIYAHPIGGGVGTTGVAFIQYNPGHPLAGFPTDSGLLAIVLETGWVGLLIQCLTYFIILQQGVYGYYMSKNPRYRILYLSSVTCLFGYVFAQYAQIAIGQIPSGFLFLALNAVIIRLRQIERVEKGAVPAKL